MAKILIAIQWLMKEISMAANHVMANEIMQWQYNLIMAMANGVISICG